jgi:hypothetical protein
MDIEASLHYMIQSIGSSKLEINNTDSYTSLAPVTD